MFMTATDTERRVSALCRANTEGRYMQFMISTARLTSLRLRFARVSSCSVRFSVTFFGSAILSLLTRRERKILHYIIIAYKCVFVNKNSDDFLNLYDFFQKRQFFLCPYSKDCQNPLGIKNAKKFKKMIKRYCNNR